MSGHHPDSRMVAAQRRYVVLKFLDGCTVEGASVQAIARQFAPPLRLDAAGKVLAQLETRGLAKGYQHRGDARRLLWEITREGRELLKVNASLISGSRSSRGASGCSSRV